MRIGVIVPELGYAGEERRAVRFAEHFRDVFGWCKIYTGIANGFETGATIPTIPVGRFRKSPLSVPTVRLIERLGDEDVALLLAFKRLSLPASWMASRVLRLPLVFNVANTWTGSRLWSAFMGDYAICISEATERWLRASARLPRFGATTIRLGIPPPTDDPPQREARDSLGLDAAAFVWLNVGRICTQKDQATLLRAFERLLAEFEEDRLVIVGSGPREVEIRQLASDLGIADNVCFTGFREDVGLWMAAADVLVQSSVREGLPHVLLEAMALSLPIVATSVGGTAEAVLDGETGLLVEPRDDRAMYDAMKRVRQEPAMRELFGTRAKQRFLECFTEQRMLSQYEARLSEFYGMWK